MSFPCRLQPRPATRLNHFLFIISRERPRHRGRWSGRGGAGRRIHHGQCDEIRETRFTPDAGGEAGAERRRASKGGSTRLRQVEHSCERRMNDAASGPGQQRRDHRQIDGVDQDLAILGETVSLFIRFWLTKPCRNALASTCEKSLKSSVSFSTEGRLSPAIKTRPSPPARGSLARAAKPTLTDFNMPASQSLMSSSIGVLIFDASCAAKSGQLAFSDARHIAGGFKPASRHGHSNKRPPR